MHLPFRTCHLFSIQLHRCTRREAKFKICLLFPIYSKQHKNISHHGDRHYRGANQKVGLEVGVVKCSWAAIFVRGSGCFCSCRPLQQWRHCPDPLYAPNPPPIPPPRLDFFSLSPSSIAHFSASFLSVIPLTCSSALCCRGARGAHTHTEGHFWQIRRRHLELLTFVQREKKDFSLMKDAACLQLRLVSFSASQSSHIFLSPVSSVARFWLRDGELALLSSFLVFWWICFLYLSNLKAFTPPPPPPTPILLFLI